MLKTVTTLLEHGGFQRIRDVQARVATRYGNENVDALLNDRILYPKSLFGGLNIIFVTCASSKQEIDLREFVDGAKHALLTTVQYMRGKSIMQSLKSDTQLKDDVNDFLTNAFAPDLYKKLLLTHDQLKNPTWYLTPQRIKSCSVVQAGYQQNELEEHVHFQIDSKISCIMQPIVQTKEVINDKVIDVTVKATFSTRIHDDQSLDWIITNLNLTTKK
ncbi:hypothetical protein THRCLA_08003 [Thraustotheca clavata]|uniref:Uncharacterized protein n=1 Tax=Thraustotheca clavata TaxID=74557 RepID=A0A1V9ZB40_9STRA|nr:hypothetical protein THRCLA_08003 [Thraustotheca clavata]